MNIQITNLERQTTNDFVTVVHYRIEKTSEELTASTYGTVSYTQDGDDFTAYADLTQSVVEGWLQDSLDMVSIEAQLDADLEAQKTPVSLSGTPW